MSRAIKVLVVAALVAGALYFGITWYVDSKVGDGIRRAAEARGASVRWDGLDVDIMDRTVVLTGVQVHWRENDYYAEQVDFRSLDHKNRPPRFAHVVVTGADVPVTAELFDWATPVLVGMDITDVRGDMTLDYAFDTGDNSLHVRRFDADLEGVGAMTLSARLHNVDPNDLGAERLVGLQFGRTALSFTDAGLLDRLSTLLIPGPEGERRQQFAATLALLAKGAEAGGQPESADAYAALGRFVRDGGTLAVNATPDEPVPWLYMYMGNSPDRMIRLLNLTISTIR
ncbi:hypothetical protein [Salidesulfovibrio brasiliensis]|uniref:hypothetical protein n=1 Tax=Salidesulfovibrio brasiliensis TaxID=221711 RepID=UPI0006D1C8E2|nr:hypothetical protein [Salidesulfovibrio brasiliensis]